MGPGLPLAASPPLSPCDLLIWGGGSGLQAEGPWAQSLLPVTRGLETPIAEQHKTRLK